jgi:alpha,alpha-trehalose phosphorylase
MIGPRFEIDPWAIRESGLDLDDLGVREAVFALSNGHIGLRGNLDEGEPADMHGT